MLKALRERCREWGNKRFFICNHHDFIKGILSFPKAKIVEKIIKGEWG